MNKLNHFLVKEPNWRAEKKWLSYEIPSSVKSWLCESGSLTRRLQRSFAGEFTVQVQGEVLTKPFYQELKSLGAARSEIMLVREVVLQIDRQAYVFARTTVPRSSLRKLQKLTHLANKPLGEVIFSFYNLKRDQLDIAKIHRKQLSKKGQALMAGGQTMWARRNTYNIDGKRLIVCEFFISKQFDGF